MKVFFKLFVSTLAVLVFCISCSEKISYTSSYTVGLYDHNTSKGYRFSGTHTSNSSSGIFVYSSVSVSISVTGGETVTPKDVSVSCGDNLTLYYLHSGNKIKSSTVKVYFKIGEDNIPLERKEDYDLVLSSYNEIGENSYSSSSISQHYDVVYVASFVVPTLAPGNYILSFCASDGDDILDKDFVTIEIIDKNE